MKYLIRMKERTALLPVLQIPCELCRCCTNNISLVSTRMFSIRETCESSKATVSTDRRTWHHYTQALGKVYGNEVSGSDEWVNSAEEFFCSPPTINHLPPKLLCLLAFPLMHELTAELPEALPHTSICHSLRPSTSAIS